MAFVQASGVIQVEMSVTRYQTFPEDGFAQVWGYVGDYEVAVCLPLTDPRVQRLLQGRKGKVGRGSKSVDNS
jgi:hypothetical protein